ncbi:META domain-containing protein [Pilimelia columellifera]|uniref:DUF306 domain-containing protein n=1 Tax=Pilimelia columellifera subsp. columellifera TaxID=706583 RepID=A0ABP6AGD2_9ACTN
MRLGALFSSVVLVPVALAGCAGSKPAEDPPTTAGASPTATTPTAAATPQAIDRRMLLGRWTPVTPTSSNKWGTPPYVQFTDDGAWQGSDGCNPLKGRWSASPGGAFQASFPGSTEMGCDNVNVGPWLASTRTVEINGNMLTLRDAGDAQVGQLRRSAGG